MFISQTIQAYQDKTKKGKPFLYFEFIAFKGESINKHRTALQNVADIVSLGLGDGSKNSEKIKISVEPINENNAHAYVSHNTEKTDVAKAIINGRKNVNALIEVGKIDGPALESTVLNEPVQLMDMSDSAAYTTYSLFRSRRQ